MIPQGIQTFPGDSRDASCAQHGAEVPPALLQAAALKQNKAQEHRQQKIEEEPYQQMDLSSFIDTGKNHVPDFGTNKG